ncbi:MAG: hypothetical protein QOE61_3109, partial [Micromonosporaceae bacterium]|nr:hypothetical protein [Micromonosporaceae bacterium]
DPAMRVETWDPTAKVRYDQQLWNELVSLRFLDAAHGALVIGPDAIQGLIFIGRSLRR